MHLYQTQKKTMLNQSLVVLAALGQMLLPIRRTRLKAFILFITADVTCKFAYQIFFFHHVAALGSRQVNEISLQSSKLNGETLVWPPISDTAEQPSLKKLFCLEVSEGESTKG